MHAVRTASLVARSILAAALVTIAAPPTSQTAAGAAAAVRGEAVATPAAATTPVLTLDQCIDLAKKSSPSLRITENALSSAALARKGLGAARLPEIRMSGSASSAPTFDRFGYDPVITDYGQIAAQIIAEETLYDGGIYGLKAKQMQLDLESFTIARKISERDIVFSVKQIFIEMLRARDEIELERQSLQQLADYLNLVKNLYAGGQVHYTDVLKTGIQLSSANASLQKARETSALAKYELAEMIGAAPDTAFEISGALDSLSIVQMERACAGGMFPQSLESRSNDLAITRSGLNVEITHREKYPTVSLTADAGLLTSHTDPLEDRWNHIGYSAGINISVPVMDWGQRRLREEQQHLAMETARYQAEAFNRSQATELHSLSLQIENLKRRMEDLQRTAKDADDNYILTKAKYLGGAAPVTEVLAAQQLVTDTRLERLQARSDVLKLSARVEQILTR